MMSARYPSSGRSSRSSLSESRFYHSRSWRCRAEQTLSRDQRSILRPNDAEPAQGINGWHGRSSNNAFSGWFGSRREVAQHYVKSASASTLDRVSGKQHSWSCAQRRHPEIQELWCSDASVQDPLASARAVLRDHDVARFAATRTRPLDLSALHEELRQFAQSRELSSSRTSALTSTKSQLGVAEFASRYASLPWTPARVMRGRAVSVEPACKLAKRSAVPVAGIADFDIAAPHETWSTEVMSHTDRETSEEATQTERCLRDALATPLSSLGVEGRRCEEQTACRWCDIATSDEFDYEEEWFPSSLSAEAWQESESTRAPSEDEAYASPSEFAKDLPRSQVTGDMDDIINTFMAGITA